MKGCCVVKADKACNLINRLMGLDEEFNRMVTSHFVLDRLKRNALQGKFSGKRPVGHEKC